jgi:crotonobetainyl-CoA:carnitine CoA-transferase CaiB-like acyl-CoA transferase
LNAGKLSLAMNLKTDEGVALARDLLGRSDIFLNNLRPGAVDRLGLGYEALHALNPSLVFCQVSAFGLLGPLASLPGGDPLAGALTGMQTSQGGYGRRPVYTYGAPIDYTSGFLAAAGALLALHKREISGVGCFMDTSLLDAGMLLNANAMTRGARREDLPRTQYRRNAVNGLYPTATDWIALALSGEEDWHRLRTALTGYAGEGLPDKQDSMSDDELAGRLESILSSRPAEAWLPVLRRAGVACAPVNARSEIRLSDSILVDNAWVGCHRTGAGSSVSFVDGWLSMSGSWCRSRGPAPWLGEHSDQLLAEMGIDHATRHRLRSEGVVTVAGG